MSDSLDGTLEQHPEFRSPPLRLARNLTVWLPPGYHAAPGRRFPVLYLHDGQNLFDPATAFLGNPWWLGGTLSGLIAAREIEPLIVVGLWNTGVHRIDEYTPVRAPGGQGGGAARYGTALVRSIKPYIDRAYRTSPGPSHTGLGGSSMGGLASLYIGLRHPDIFGKLMVMSPSVWWAERQILRWTRRAKRVPGQRIWLDTGTLEGSAPLSMLEEVRALRDVLTGKGWRTGIDLSYCEDDGAAHCEQAWGARARRALRFLFPASDSVESYPV